jgi:hypothetical protein
VLPGSREAFPPDEPKIAAIRGKHTALWQHWLHVAAIMAAARMMDAVEVVEGIVPVPLLGR